MLNIAQVPQLVSASSDHAFVFWDGPFLATVSAALFALLSSCYLLLFIVAWPVVSKEVCSYCAPPPHVSIFVLIHLNVSVLIHVLLTKHFQPCKSFLSRLFSLVKERITEEQRLKKKKERHTAVQERPTASVLSFALIALLHLIN